MPSQSVYTRRKPLLFFHKHLEKTSMMETSSQSHRDTVEHYFTSNFVKPILLTDGEVNRFNTISSHLLREVGDLHWLTRILIHSLDVYWKKIGNTSPEYGLRHEGMIGDYMRQVVMGRQFSRFPFTTDNNQIDYRETSSGFSDLWHPYHDSDLPAEIDDFDEPYRTIFSLIRVLSNQLLETGSDVNAMNFSGSLMAAFALTYPMELLDMDPSFQQYLANEVQDIPKDDDYTFYLCRMMDYLLLNRS